MTTILPVTVTLTIEDFSLYFHDIGGYQGGIAFDKFLSSNRPNITKTIINDTGETTARIPPF